MPEEPPLPQEPGVRVFDIPEERAPAPAESAPAPAPAKPAETEVAPAAPAANGGDGAWWRTLAEKCKGRLPVMYRAFLDMCVGQIEGDLLTVWAPDEITYGRLDNDRVRTALQEEAEQSAGKPVRLTLRVGEAPKATPQENLKNLLKFGSQFDNIEIK